MGVETAFRSSREIDGPGSTAGANLTRFHGVFASHSRYRARWRGLGSEQESQGDEQTPAEKRASMTWVERLNRVFGIDVEVCPASGGAVQLFPEHCCGQAECSACTGR